MKARKASELYRKTEIAEEEKDKYLYLVIYRRT